MIDFEYEQEQYASKVNIKVIGVGGAGGNAVNSMIDAGLEGITFIATNTDAQALFQSRAQHKIQLGVKSTKGLGAGANAELGKRAAEEDIDKVLELVADAEIVFLAGGMGGGTGSGALPVIARALKEKGTLSIAVVTKPFEFEGKRRAAVADKAIELLKSDVDTLLILPNQKLLDAVEANVSMIDAFAMINGVLTQSVKGIADIIIKPGHINVDFADVRAIMKGMGLAIMGTGRARGERRAQEAALRAISSPLLENMSIEGARSVLLNISGGVNLGLHELSQAASIIYEKADQDATIILGSVIDETLTDEVIVTVIATGFHPVCVTASVRQADVVEPVAPAVVNAVAQQPQVQPVVQATAQPEVAVNNVVHVAPVAVKVMEPVEVVEEKAAMQVEVKAEERAVIDVNDLDVPTFLRNSYVRVVEKD